MTRTQEGAPDALRAELLQILKGLEDLNPDIPERVWQRLKELCTLCGPDAFPQAAAQVRRLLELYLHTGTLRVGSDALKEYHRFLEKGVQKLLESGEITPRDPHEEDPSTNHADSGVSRALALPHPREYAPLDRCKILQRTEIPESLTRAADAFRRRVEVVDTVYGIGFQALWLLDPGAFQRWVAELFREQEGSLAPEVIRDALWVMRWSPALSSEIREWLLRWCGDPALLEEWPLVARYADGIADRLFLRHWNAHGPAPRTSNLAHLRLLVKMERLDDPRLLSWLENALQEFGASVQRFLSLGKDAEATGGEKASDAQEEEWLHQALLAELHGMESAYQPMIVLSDHLLRLPDGAMKLAMAFLGMVGQSLREWEEAVRIFAEKVIRRAFLVDLKEGRTPVETIRRFTFGDEVAFAQICNNLDLLSRQFDSIKQREIVVRRLSIYYASYRRAPLMGQEVARRYRRLARLLHQDYLQNHLTSQELEAFQQNGFLRELYSMVARAKRFLDHRRALEMSVEEMVASQMEFVEECRARRQAVLRQALKD